MPDLDLQPIAEPLDLQPLPSVIPFAPKPNPRPLAGRLADAASSLIGDAKLGTGFTGAAQDLSNPLVAFARPFMSPQWDPSKPSFTIPRPGPKTNPILGGAADFASALAEGLTTPDVMGQIALGSSSGMAAKLVSLPFLTDMVIDAPEAAADVGTKLGQGDTRGATAALLRYGMGVLPAYGIASEHGPLLTDRDKAIALSRALDKTSPLDLQPLETLPMVRTVDKTPEGEQNASKNETSTEVHGDVQPQPIQSQGEVPPEVSSTGVQSRGRATPQPAAEINAPPAPATEEPPQAWKSAGPGAAAAGQPGTYSPIQQLTDQIEATAPKGKPPGDKIRFIDQLKLKGEAAKDAVKGAFAKAVAVKNALVDGYTNLPEITDYKRIKGYWDYALQKADDQSRTFLKTIRKEVPSKLRQEAITNWIQADGDLAVLRDRASKSKAPYRAGYEAALDLTPREKELAGMIRDYFDRQLYQGQQEGVLKHGLEDYVTQVWKKENPITRKLMSELSSEKLQPNFRYARKRMFDSYFEGEQAGYKPASKAIGDLLSHYDQTFNRVLAAREFLRNLRDKNASDGRPLVEVSGYGKPVEEMDAQGNPVANTVQKYVVKPRALGDKLQGYRTIDHPALRGWKWAATTADGKPIMFEGPLVVHPEIYQDLKNVLSTSRLRQTPWIREALQLQGFVKNSMLTFAGFHHVQEAVHAMGHKVNPVNVPRIDMEEPVTKALVEGGLQVANFNAAQEFGEGAAGVGLAKYIPYIGPKLHEYTQYLFQDYIPRLKVSMAKDALERNRLKYAKQIQSGKITDEQLVALTARESNAAFGEENLRSLGRNPNFHDALRLFLFAPDFLISRGKFVGQAMTPYGNEQLAALGRMAITMYVGARLANKASDDDWHWEPRNAFSVIYKNHRYSLRTVPGDILHLLTDPRSFWFNRISPGARLGVEAATGRDDRGVRRDLLHQLKDAAQTPVPLGLRKRDDQNLLEAFANSFGLQTQRETPEQQMREKVENWKLVHNVGQSAFEETYDAEKDAYRPLRVALESGDASKAKDALAKLKEVVPAGKIAESMKRHYTHPLTGSKANEIRFLQTLSKGERDEYEAARKDRLRQLVLFEQVMSNRVPVKRP